MWSSWDEGVSLRMQDREVVGAVQKNGWLDILCKI